MIAFAKPAKPKLIAGKSGKLTIEQGGEKIELDVTSWQVACQPNKIDSEKLFHDLAKSMGIPKQYLFDGKEETE